MIDVTFLYVVLFILVALYISMIAFIVWRQRAADNVQSDLLTRLMSRSVGEYAEAKKRIGAPVASFTVADAVSKLTDEGIAAEEAFASQVESDSVRIS